MKGLRTFIGAMVGIAALVAGLFLLDPLTRHEAYFAFAGAIVGVLGTLAAKSVGTAAVSGEGLKGGLANLLTSTKPGEPKP